jgi:ATP-binding cassette, subfamily F, member 3
MTFGYLPQDGLQLSGKHRLRRMHVGLRQPARPGARDGRAHPQDRRARSTSNEYAQVPIATTASPTEFRVKDGYTLDSQVGHVLDGLGFPKKIGHARPKSSPAAGRCASRWPSCCCKSPTCCCSTSPPTTSIWKRATGWSNICSNYPFAYVLISHDRYFLDVTVNKTAEIWNKRVHFYSGNYEKYLRRNRSAAIRWMSAYKNQRDRIEQLEAFINRFRYQATKAKQVQSRIKELEKIERIEVPRTRRPSTSPFRSPSPAAASWSRIQNYRVAKSYGEKQFFAT